jgi:predicted component of type VI protein secretion system
MHCGKLARLRQGGVQGLAVGYLKVALLLHRYLVAFWILVLDHRDKLELLLQLLLQILPRHNFQSFATKTKTQSSMKCHE